MQWWLVVAIGGFSISVLTKVFVEFSLPRSVHIALNPGLAFGVVFPAPLQYVLIGCAFIAILWFFPQWSRRSLCQIGIGLILGGGSANLLDRFLGGSVTDFIVLWPFPLFNVADVCITFGAFLLVLGEYMPTLRRALAGLKGEW